MSSAVISLVIFGICIILFVFSRVSIAITAMLGLVAMILTGVCSFGDGFRFFGTTTVILIASMMVVGRAAFHTGLAQSLGERVLRLAKGDERKVILYGSAVTALTSAFLSNIATLSVMIYIVAGICGSNKNVKFRNVIMPIAGASVLGGSATLIGSTPQLTAQGMLEDYLGVGNAFHFFTFAVPALLMIAAYVFYVGFVGYPLGKRIWGARADADEIPMESSHEQHPVIDSSKLSVMAVIFAVMFFLFVSCEYLKELIPGLNMAVIGVAAAAACILTGCIPREETLSSINWSLVIWLGASLGMAGAMNASGGGELIAGAFTSMLGDNISHFALYCAFVVTSIVLTQFLSNSTVLALLLPVAFSIVSALGCNIYPFAVGMTIGSAIAISTPLANTTIAMSMIANYRFSDYVRYSWPITIISTIIVCTVVPILFPL